MAFTSGFFNSVNHDRKYDAVQMGQIFDGIIKDGIYATYLSAMVVKESANASEVIVQPGRAWFNHVWAYNDADYPMAAPDPEVVLDRIDTLVLDVNSEDAVREAKYMWVQGTPTSQIPEPPTLIHTVTHNQYPLADVYRQAGTTQIYAADITNRVGTSDCPFVTGIIETINIDSLLTQWDAEFHTWEAATKNAFEGWMLNQEGAYTLWWNSMKSQMEDDVEELEAWIATIHDILDEEVATRLQAEIDEIKTQLPTGSYIKVTTTDTELFNRTVTITDEDNNTVTSTFNASGVAIFKTVPYVGYLTIESTDGIRVATNTVETPYFARYAFNLAFWSATVNISADTELGGETCVVKNSEAIVVTSIVLNAEGEGVFNATYPDTYTFSVTHGGETMEVSLAVTQETTYSVEIHGGFNWRGWLDASVDLDSSDYTDLDDVLSDEKAIRELFLVHDCVDYLAAVSTANTDVETILNNDLAAKWINNSDYALDTLSANAALKTVMDEADKYGYGEWVIVDDTTTPPTWAPKGAVPKMTSNSAPYGEVQYSTAYSGSYPYTVFDKTQNYFAFARNRSNDYIGYKFTNPICPKSVYVETPDAGYSDQSTITSIIIQGSNDGTNYTDLKTESVGSSVFKGNIDIETSSYYLYLRAYFNYSTADSAHNGYITTIQFYGRQLSVSVPVMTSNTAPFGEAFAKSTASNSAAYKAFDGNSASSGWANPWGESDTIGNYIGYKFDKPVVVKMAMIDNVNQTTVANICAKAVQLQGSDDTNYSNIGNEISLNSYSKVVIDYSDNDIAYRNIRFLINDSYNVSEVGVMEAQFYGLDYSEKEFEAGTNKKWLYDHGVELDIEELSTSNGWTAYNGTTTSGASFTPIKKESSDLYFSFTSDGDGQISGVGKQLNDVYSLVNAIVDGYVGSSNTYGFISIYSNKSTNNNNRLANVNVSSPQTSQRIALDISSVASGNYLVMASSNGRSMYLKELWVE